MQREMNVLEIIQALIKRYKILLAIVLLFGFLGGGISFLLNNEEYNSTISLIVGEETQKETDQINQINGEPIYEEVIEYGGFSISDNSKKLYSETIKRTDVLEKIISNLNLDLEPTELRENITMETPENSSSLFITISSTEIEEVDLVAEEVANVFMNEIYDITGIDKIKVLNNATNPIIENSINFGKNILISIIIGVAVSFVAILILEYLDDSIQESVEIEKILNIPILGELRSKNTLKEDIKMVRANLEYSENLKDKRIISLTAVDNDANIAVNLTDALSEINKDVFLLDADFREPIIDKILNIPNDYGLSNLLNKEIKIEEILKLTKKNNVLTTGDELKNPSEKLSSIKMKKLLRELKVYFDYIIINGHKINMFTDTLELSTLTDGTIILVEQNKTSLKELKKVKKELNNVNSNIIGIIFKKYK